MNNNFIKIWFSDKQKEIRNLQIFIVHIIFKNQAKLTFKGGTALDIFYNSGRFSEGLDFDADNLEELVVIDEGLDSIKKETNFAIFNNWYNDRHIYKNFIRYYLKISSPKLTDLFDFVIDYTIDRTEKPSDKFNISINNMAIKISVMQSSEMLAEKAAAILTRSKPRDLYDLYYLAVIKKVPIEAKLIYKKSFKKFSEKKPVPYSFDVFEKKIYELKPYWNDLSALINNFEDYDFNDIADNILKRFKNV
ncbi:MAG: nucleotidyl transferase AbiEii/AbiGii toxin family protein [Candidatus Marsarchaeota archaeon]|nr:nucleotidyl transferase AbiEii/AbiGii toxin family protein [Candidatus Marsarchaeota archaeon]